MVVLDGNCAVGCGAGTDWMVTMLQAVDLERIGWYLCCRLWGWNGLDGNYAVGCGLGTDWMVTVLQAVGLERIGWYLCCRLWGWNGVTLNTYISIYARTNRCYNERGSRTNYVRSSVPHSTSYSQTAFET